MARLRDVPVVVRRIGFWRFVGRVWREVGEDNLFAFAAALAYAWLFALFPFIIFLLNVISRLPPEHIKVTTEGIHTFLEKSLPDLAAATLKESVNNTLAKIQSHPNGGVLSVSLLVALWAASGGVNVTMYVLDKCYELDRTAAFRAFHKRRPMALGLTAGISLLVMLIVLLLPVGAMFRAYHADHVPAGALFVFDAVRVILALFAAMGVLNLVYHFGPGVKQHWAPVTPGAVFSLCVWVLVGFAFRYYVNHFGRTNYGETYGTVGGVAILLLFFYLDALVLLIGAEINSEIDFEVLGVERGSNNFRPANGLGAKRPAATAAAIRSSQLIDEGSD